MSLDDTVAALESGLRVRDIATTKVKACRPHQSASAILRRADLLDFDQIPVVGSRRFVGVLERSESIGKGAIVGDVMRPLDDSLLIEAELPLPRFLPLVLNSPYFLVVMGSRIGGLVTRSDLIKMPVRLVAFAHVAHLETQMARLISRIPDAEWLALMVDGGKRTLRAAERLSGDRLDPNLIELTLFSEKRQIVSRLLDLPEADIAELQAIEKMRNAVAHGSEYGRTNSELRAFVGSLSSVEAWLQRLDFSRDGRGGSRRTQGRWG